MGLDSDADPTTGSVPTGLVSDNTLPLHLSTGLDSDADPHGRFNTVCPAGRDSPGSDEAPGLSSDTAAQLK